MPRRIANIALNDAMILPYNANPGRMEFSERTGVLRRVDAVAKAYEPRHASDYQKADLAQRSTNVYATLDAY